MRIRFGLMVLGLCVACSDPAPPGVAGGDSSGGTGSPDAISDGGNVSPSDEGGGNVIDLGQIVVPDLGHDDLFGEDEGPPLTDFGDPAKGQFGSPCVENSECDDGFCVTGPDDKYVCSKLCVEDCPPGWLCKGVPQTEPDVLFICIWGQVELCAECDYSEECRLGYAPPAAAVAWRQAAVSPPMDGACGRIHGRSGRLAYRRGRAVGGRAHRSGGAGWHEGGDPALR